MREFDLIEYQQRARMMASPARLFALWQDLCQRYESGEINAYELQEMKDVIWPSLQALDALRRQVDQTNTDTPGDNNHG